MGQGERALPSEVSPAQGSSFLFYLCLPTRTWLECAVGLKEVGDSTKGRIPRLHIHKHNSRQEKEGRQACQGSHSCVHLVGMKGRGTAYALQEPHSLT